MEHLIKYKYIHIVWNKYIITHFVIYNRLYVKDFVKTALLELKM